MPKTAAGIIRKGGDTRETGWRYEGEYEGITRGAF